MARIQIIEGDITTRVSVDAIVTLVNSGGFWFGGVDGAIVRVAGSRYHNQLEQVRKEKGLANGQVVVAKGHTQNHFGEFKDVVFVVDDLVSPLGDLVYIALKAARDSGYLSVALPLMRTGVMLGVVEPDIQAVVSEMKNGLARFFSDGSSDMVIYIVVYNDLEATKLLNDLT